MSRLSPTLPTTEASSSIATVTNTSCDRSGLREKPAASNAPRAAPKRKACKRKTTRLQARLSLHSTLYLNTDSKKLAERKLGQLLRFPATGVAPKGPQVTLNIET